MKAFHGPNATGKGSGLILLLSEKRPALPRDSAMLDVPDEHNRTDILTSGLNLAPAFPVFSSGFGSL